ncbi:MAG: hypothetical protein JNL82_37325 [Myxococcales bacterium]|nr:hypothetical protein [Myxococcales bacterium]
MALLEELSELVVPTLVSLELTPSGPVVVEVVVSVPVVTRPVDSVVVGAVTGESTAEPEDELLDEPGST